MLTFLGVLVAGHTLHTNGEGEAHAQIVKDPALANLWLCNTGAPACINKEGGVEEVNVNVDLDQAITVGSFEFKVDYDARFVRVNVVAGELLDRPDVTCTAKWRREGGQNFIHFDCATAAGTPDPPMGPGTLAVVRVRPSSDIYAVIIANQDNGIATPLMNRDCLLSELDGSAILIDPCLDASVTVRYLEGDVHADCAVNAMDQQQVAFRYGARLGSVRYSYRLDLEPSAPIRGDGDIDARDLQFVFGRHGSTCEDPHPPQDPKAS